MTFPKVTVMMMVYNSEKYLSQAINSILNQTFNNFELLIIDDASTDRSYEIIRSYNDTRIRVIRNTTNRGVAYSRKKAQELAFGEYIAILDSDDLAFKERLQVQVDYLDANPDIHLVGSAHGIIDEDGNLEGICTVPTDPLTIRWRLLFGNCITHSTVMFRKSTALELGGYDDKVFAGEDFDLWVRFAAYSKIAQLNQPLGQWRRHPHSLYHSEPIEVKDHFIRTVIKSIRMQTGQNINLQTAKSLFSNIPKCAPNRQVVLNAYTTIITCLDKVQASRKMIAYERIYLIYLALEKIIQIAILNPGSCSYALWAALHCIYDRKRKKISSNTSDYVET